MSLVSLSSLDSLQLSRLLDMEGMVAWTQRDAAAALRHQLTASLSPDLLECPEVHRACVDRLRSRAPAVPSFAGALTDERPDLVVLEGIKRFSQYVRRLAENPLSGAPATCLYYAAIAASLLRRNVRITSLTDAQLREGFSWAAVQEGAEPLRRLFLEALDHLEPSAD